jgi:acetolactate synthase-1/2/3 large subunit
MVTGGMAMYINKAVSSEERLGATFVHHEQAAICAAEGWSKSGDFKSIGFACVTAGPGVTNAITGLVAAYGDSVPMLILAGQIKTEDLNFYGLRTHGIQEVDSKSLVTPAVKKFIRIKYEKLEEQVLEIREALSLGRKGPVFVEIPLDVQSMEVSPEVFRNLEPVPMTGIESIQSRVFKLKDTLERLKTKNLRIGVVIGNGLRISGVKYLELLSLLKRRNVPTFYTWLSFDMYDYYQENNMGCPGSFASSHSNASLQECDVVVVLGARIDLATSAFQREVYGAKGVRIFIDIDELELTKFSREKDYTFCIDIKYCIETLESFFDSVEVDKDWFKSLVDRKSESITQENVNLATTDLSVRSVALAVSEFVKEGVIVSASSGLAEEIFTRFLRPNGRLRFFNSAALGAMGQGLSHGIGAALYRGDEKLPIFVFEGDGGLWMQIHELATVAQKDLKNFHLFILNNGGYASIRNSQQNHFGYKYGCDKDSGLLIPDFAKLAEMFGFNYREVQFAETLSPEFFSKLMKSGARTIVDLKLAGKENVGPKLKTIIKNGKPTTEPFGDLGW